MPEFQIEMLWRCPCGKENRGRDTKCEADGGCGRPRTDKEEFYMPGDTSEAARVVEPELLREATAGPDWKCKYCRSNQRKLDGTCEQCGASQDQAVADKTPAPAEPPQEEEPPQRQPVVRGRALLVLCTLAAVLAVVLGLWALFRTKVIDASITAMQWEHAVAVERYQVYHREGWTPGYGATHVMPLGERYHHTDHVVSGHHDEAYQDKESCGQTCTPTPRTCRTTPKTCTSNKNGYATCTGGDQVCTGGGQSCVTKYCSVTKHRSVTDYVDIPRTQMWWGWEAWDWGHDRWVKLAGGVPARGDALPWPTEEALRPLRPLAAGEEERTRREEKYVVTFSGDGSTYPYAPADEATFRGYAVGDHRQIKVSIAGGVEVLPGATGDY